LKPGVAIGVYRITEEALRLISGPLKARSITLDAEVDDSNLTVLFSHDGSAISADELETLPEYKSMSQRIATLHGTFTVNGSVEGEWRWRLVVPIDPIGPLG
jgi:signal transduction histidine kinase